MQRIFHLEEIDEVAGEIIQQMKGHRCVAFYAEMGSGKTTLISALCKAMQVVDHVSSPTFSIMNEYRTEQGQKIVHMDGYRLKNTEDAIHAGVQDVLDDPETLVWIEWPERIEELLPKEYLAYRITPVDETRREITRI